MRIDAHQHFWRIDDRKGGWPPPALAPIHRDFLPGDLLPLMKAAGIDGTVLVQSLPSAADTDFMLDLSNDNPFILGVVGWADLKAADATETIERLSQHPKLKGLRPMLQDIADDRWIDDERLDPAIDAMRRYGLVFDALVLPRHLPALTVFARRHPDLPIVIDHGAKPVIAQGHYSAWRTGMKTLAALPNVSCKLSGLLTEAGDQKPQAIRPYAETILELFGAHRTIWGSDWPVLDLAGDYQSWLSQCMDIVPAADHTAVFGGNALSFYRLNTSRSTS